MCEQKKYLYEQPGGPSIFDRPESFHLSTNKSYVPVGFQNTGIVQQVTSNTWPVLTGVGMTTFVYVFLKKVSRYSLP